MTSVRPGPGLRTASQTSDLVPMRLRPASASSGRNCAGCAEWSTVRRPGRHPVKRSAVTAATTRSGCYRSSLMRPDGTTDGPLVTFQCIPFNGQACPELFIMSRGQRLPPHTNAVDGRVPSWTTSGRMMLPEKQSGPVVMTSLQSLASPWFTSTGYRPASVTVIVTPMVAEAPSSSVAVTSTMYSLFVS